VHLPDGFAEAYAAFVEAGWVTAAPASGGGDGLPGSIRAGLGEIWNASNAAFALCWLLSAGRSTPWMPRRRTSCETYLAKLVSGEWTGTMNLTEPAAGTDLGAIRTIATPRGDGTWSIKGQKIFITWGDHDVAENIVHLVLARTPGAPRAPRAVAVRRAEVPRQRRRLARRPQRRRDRRDRAQARHPRLADVRALLRGRDRLPRRRGRRGLAGMFVMMNSARIGMGFQATGIADRALQQAEAYAAERMQGRVLERGGDAPIAEHPDVRRLLLSMRSDVFAMRALGVYVGDLFDRAEASGTPPTSRSPSSSCRSSRAGRRRMPSRSRATRSRCTAAWASSRRPAPRSTTATRIMPIYEARPRSSRTTSSAAR
jgi:alkylation response protein AidB-like acyl-CoA dehydrogenase